MYQTQGDRGSYIFDNAAASADAEDLTLLAQLATRVGTRRTGTAAERKALDQVWLFPGLSWFDTDTRTEWVHNGTDWVPPSPDPSTATGGVQTLGSVGPDGRINDISARTFTEALPRLVHVTLTATASAVTGGASGNLYLRLNGRDIIVPATARQHRLAAGSQNFISLSAIARTQGGSNTVSFAATADPGTNVIQFEQIALGVKAFS